MKTSNTQYIILPGKITSPNTDSSTIALFDQTYFFWKDIWNSTYQGNGIDKEVSPDDFFRQNYVAIIKNEVDIIALHLYSIYNLSSQGMREQSYLKDNFNEHFFSVMEKENIKLAMSMESLSVNPKYRKTHVGQAYFIAISLLGVHLFKNLTGCDAIIAPARCDVGVAQAAEKVGFITTDRNVILYNTPVDLIYFKRSTKENYPNDFMEQEVKELWNARSVFLNAGETTYFKKAA
ncbi:MAG: hypothetical protein A2381_14910 [Bdellovibrionales bacterium RIFOXYB1_FULL_37_110]|nr:MAG: hypothetical protein A2417_10415 [Bdellovibrionales bacterium RIFOXYC1_FULL_37_79]OFZ60155.1 MAG: hypothetical protein A2381_14910 [Bdellovibrionales bacterium RIFOXYB1_FULL_37_110]OFZ64351.1 MAG: hypothetical protein A2577_09860 [Bdellovibrionales bacterium RIFOXYD1_FULL_36_51]